MAKSQEKPVSANKPQRARAKTTDAVKASVAPKVAVPSEAAAGFAFSGEIEQVATPVPPLSSKARARAKRAAKAAQTPAAYPHKSRGLFADAEAEEKAAKGVTAAKAARKRQGAAAGSKSESSKTSAASDGYVDEAKRVLKTARVSLSDVIDAIPPIPWEEWRLRVGAGLGTTLVHAGKWLAERGFELARESEIAASSRKSDAAATAETEGAELRAEAPTSTFAEQHPNADQHEERA